MGNKILSVVLTSIAIVGVTCTAAAQSAAPLPTIHRVTIDTQSRVLTITGAGLGPDLVVSVEGTSAPVLSGATDSQIEIALAPALLTMPGTYRLTVVDPVRQAGDTFVVASQPAGDGPGSAVFTGTSSAASGAAPALNRSTAVSPTAAIAPSHAGGSTPMTIIEDPASPYLTAIGYGALFSNTSGWGNTASGYEALSFNTSGYFNTASGYQSLISNTTGNTDTATGFQSLFSNTSGSFNTANGFHALLFNTTGLYNTANGSYALSSNTTGEYNTASGMNALTSNTTAFYNTAHGHNALYSNTGPYNTASGVNALYSNTDGVSNTANGMNALFLNTTGAKNVAVGFSAGYYATTGSYNLFLGADVFGTAADSNTIRIGLPYNSGTGVGQNQAFIAGIYGTHLTGGAQLVYIDANGQLGTAPQVPTGGFFLPTVQLQQQVRDQQKKLRDLEAVNNDLRARLARVEATVAKLGSGK